MLNVTEYCLTCPVCGETYVVDQGVKEMLTDTGCAACGGSVSPPDFTERAE